MEKITNQTEVNLSFPSNLIIIPRLVVSGLLSNEKVTIEEIENIKLIISEAVNLLILPDSTTIISIKMNLAKIENQIKFKAHIQSQANQEIIKNLSKNGLTIYILNYLCSKFVLKENSQVIEITIEKDLKSENL
ncbi:MAG: hypothetical protein ABDH21_03715 [bacterium]